MSDLTATEKTQVAVLLGWKPCLVQHADFTDFARWEYADGTLSWADFPVTLEACMEYAKGKGWDVRLEMWLDPHGEPYASYDVDVERPYGEGNIVRQVGESDPKTAFVRALLKAEAAS